MKKVLFLFMIALFTVSSATANDFPTIDNDDVKVENVVEADFQFGQLYFDQMIETQSLPPDCPPLGPDMECEWNAQLETCTCVYVRTGGKPKKNE